MLPANTILSGRYKLLDTLGAGGAATVYRAQDQRLGRIVAVKVLRPEYVADAEQRARFANEARSAAALTGPNVVDVYDYGQDAGVTYIVMQYIDGEDLKRYIAARGRLAPREAARIAADTARGLEAAHERGLIHRDVKPQNIMIDRHGQVRLTDFGIAKALGGAGLTQAGMTYGTAAYLSPEQATGAPIGPFTDVYGLGLVLYEMLCGAPPFEADNAAAVAYKQVYEQPQPPSACAPNVPPQLDAIVLRALAKDPAARYTTASDMAADLQGFLLAQDRVSYAPAGRQAGAVPVPAAAPAAGVTAPAPPAPAAGYLPTAAYDAPAASSPYATFNGAQAARTPAARRTPVWLLIPLALLLLGAWLLAGRFLPQNGGTGVASPTAAAVAPAASSTAVASGGAVGTQPPATTAPAPAATAAPTEAAPGGAPAPTEAAPGGAPATDVPPTEAPPTEAPAAEPTTPPAPPTAPPAAGGEKGRPIFDTPTPPTGANRSVSLEDVAFEGGYRYPPPSVYEGRTAVWVYGQGTSFASMTAPFRLAAQPAGTATLTLAGMDSEGAAKTPLRILVNGQTIFNGPDPLPNDYSPSAGGWGAANWTFPASVLRPGENTLTIENLSPSSALGIPFIMIDSAQLRWDAEQ
jgi:tRNA A-37 threonylcarbamoyl transferase component Bud32